MMRTPWPTLALAAWLTLAPVPAAAAPVITAERLAERLTEALPSYVNRAYTRERVPGNLVLTSNPRLTPAAGDAVAIQFLTLDRFLQRGELFPVLVERTVVVAPSGGRWWLSDVRSVFRPIPEELDGKLGPYLEDIPVAQNSPPTLAGWPPYIALESAFAQAVTTWLRDVQLPDRK
ncbi:MAG: hypothetical protein KME03_14120 [Aphanocapsa lilacina HA4352-LM1]|jgi:hypothetical protein|nr:hypothetical protein [Aphanocapsa lilacina HA4352-LM1]